MEEEEEEGAARGVELWMDCAMRALAANAEETEREEKHHHHHHHRIRSPRSSLRAMIPFTLSEDGPMAMGRVDFSKEVKGVAEARRWHCVLGAAPPVIFSGCVLPPKSLNAKSVKKALRMEEGYMKQRMISSH